MTRRKKNPLSQEKPKPRPIDWGKYPRALDAKHGMTMVEDLFPDLTPEGFAPAEPPKPKDED